MARINIEQDWWTDPRRSAFALIVGNPDTADGIVMRAWKLAQDHWKHDRKLIPEVCFGLLPFASGLLQVGLAESRDDGIYVRGCREYHDWVCERVTAAKKGGVASGASRKTRPNKINNLVEANAKQTQPNTKQTQPSGSVSGSVSGSDDFFEITQKKSDAELNPTQVFIARYCEEFKLKYKTNPPMLGKGAGIAGRVVKSLGVKRACELIPTFFAMTDPMFLQNRHDLVWFEIKLNAIVVAHDTGSVITRTEADQVDKRQANFNAFAQAEQRIQDRTRNGQ